MKKLFVSVPMKGRTREEIDQSILVLKQIAEIYEGEPLMLINSFVTNTPPEDTHQAVWYLGQSIMKLSEADVFIGIEESYDWSGCHIELEVACKYGIKVYRVPARYVIPHYDEIVTSVNIKTYN